MDKFKVGDRVTCINASYRYFLEKGEIYTITAASGLAVRVPGCGNVWLSSNRFKPAHSEITPMTEEELQRLLQ